MPWSDGNRPKVSALGDALRLAGYTEGALRAAVGTGSSLAHDRRGIEIALRRLSASSRLHTLIKLFCLGVPVPASELSQYVGPGTMEDLVDLKVVRREQESIFPVVAIDAAEDLMIAHDMGARNPPPAADHVIGLGPAPRTLAALTVRSTVRRVLDLGAGSGVQALLALSHADEVVATDINPRALAYTHFNAALNRLATPATRQGDLFNPVSDDRFDLIVANPPYVLSPESSLRFRDSGMVGDELSRTVVREAGRHLNDGGFASILVSWAHEAEDDWAAPLVAWVREANCDALLLHFRTYDPLTYAALWIKDEAEFAQTLDRWLAYYQRLGIRAMSSGAVILHRRSGVNWWRSAQVQAAPIHNASDHVLRIFGAGDRLGQISDSELLDQRWRPHPSHRVHRTGVSRGGTYRVEGQYLESVGGIPLRVSMGEFGSRLLMLLDGEHSLRGIISELTGKVETMTSAEVGRVAIQTVKQLFGLGFLETDASTLGRRAAVTEPKPAERNERSLVTS